MIFSLCAGNWLAVCVCVYVCSPAISFSSYPTIVLPMYYNCTIFHTPFSVSPYSAAAWPMYSVGYSVDFNQNSFGQFVLAQTVKLRHHHTRTHTHTHIHIGWQTEHESKRVESRANDDQMHFNVMHPMHTHISHMCRSIFASYGRKALTSPQTAALSTQCDCALYV